MLRVREVSGSIPEAPPALMCSFLISSLDASFYMYVDLPLNESFNTVSFVNALKFQAFKLICSEDNLRLPQRVIQSSREVLVV